MITLSPRWRGEGIRCLCGRGVWWPAVAGFRIWFPSYRDNRQHYLHSCCHHNGRLGHRHHILFSPCQLFSCIWICQIIHPMEINVVLFICMVFPCVLCGWWCSRVVCPCVVLFMCVVCPCVGDNFYVCGVPVCGDDTWLDPETAAGDAVDTKVPLYIHIQIIPSVYYICTNVPPRYNTGSVDTKVLLYIHIQTHIHMFAVHIIYQCATSI